MESFAALLTGVLLVIFLAYVRIGARAEARKRGGELLCTISRRPPTMPRMSLLVWAGFVLFVFAWFDYGFNAASSFYAFQGGFFLLWFVMLFHMSSRNVELRQYGFILPEHRPRPFVPWSHVHYCQWVNCGRKLFIELRDRDITLKTKPTQVETVTAVLLPRVRLRDETGKVLNPERKRLHIDAPRHRDLDRHQFHLRTLLLLLVVASSGFAWFGIRLRAVQQYKAALARQEAALEKYEKFQPVICRVGNSVFGLVFSQCQTRLADADLVHLKDLPQLYFLDLSNTQVTDAGLMHLGSLEQLQSVVLNGTHVTEDGVRKLQEALPSTQIAH